MIRLATYNIKHASLKGLEAVADVLSSIDADLVALQEVDLGTVRSGGVDQVAFLGQRLSMYHAFGPAFAFEGGHYGVAVLSRWPLRLLEVLELPSAPGEEQRVCLMVEVEEEGGDPLLVGITHLGLDPSERMAQSRMLASRLHGRTRTLLLGDLNEGHTEPCFRHLASGMVDCLEEGSRHPLPLRSYPSTPPTIGIDHILRSADLPPAIHAGVVRTEASDHLPVVVELGSQSTGTATQLK